MKREEALTLLREHAAELHELGVAHLHLYGSVARDKAEGDSDVDILVTPAAATFSLFDLVGIKQFLQDILRCSVDVLTLGSLKKALPAIRDRVNADLIAVF